MSADRCHRDKVSRRSDGAGGSSSVRTERTVCRRLHRSTVVHLCGVVGGQQGHSTCQNACHRTDIHTDVHLSSTNIHGGPKKVTVLACCIFDIYTNQPSLIIFGRNVAKKIIIEMPLFFHLQNVQPLSVNPNKQQ